jgi:hypothetical protein
VRAPEGSADRDGLVVFCAATNRDDVKLADTPQAFAPAVAREAPIARDAVLVRRRREFAALHLWTERAERQAEMIGVLG